MSTATLPAQIARAYRAMAALGHRPFASENCAHMQEHGRLDFEASAYTREFLREDASGSLAIGCADAATAAALIFTIEAARCLCAGRKGDTVAAALLRAATEELTRVRKKREAQVFA